MKLKSLFSLSLSLLPAVICAQTKLTSSQLQNMQKSKTYSNVAVHDPSVVYNPSDTYYYIVGSHIGVAKSKDCPVTSNEKKDVYLCLYSTGGK